MLSICTKINDLKWPWTSKTSLVQNQNFFVEPTRKICGMCGYSREFLKQQFKYLQWALKMHLCCKPATHCVSAVQGHPRSMILQPIESTSCDFLFVVIIILVKPCTVYGIRRLIGWKLRIFLMPLSFGAPAPYVPCRFCGEVNHEETKVMELLRDESCMVLTSTIFDWSTRVTDTQTYTGLALCPAAYSTLSIYADVH